MLSIDQLFDVKQSVTKTAQQRVPQPINGMRGQFGMIANEFTKELVKDYATFNQSACQYQLELFDLPDFIVNEFASHLLADDANLLSEATGPDNPNFDKMKDALTDYLRDVTDKDNQIEFLKIWRDGVTDYAKSIMEEKLEEAVYAYNMERNLLKANPYD